MYTITPQLTEFPLEIGNGSGAQQNTATRCVRVLGYVIRPVHGSSHIAIYRYITHCAASSERRANSGASTAVD